MKLYYKCYNQNFLSACAKGNINKVSKILSQRPIDYRCVIKGLKMSIITGQMEFVKWLFARYNFNHKFGRNTILDIFNITVETNNYDLAIWIINKCIE
jgi:hypothetical protein